jgi:uncharacterized membrane protein
MYKPAAFLISITALTSIFSFFFGGYYRERERAYRLWLMFVAYGQKSPKDEEKLCICSELESRNRMFFQAKGLLLILLLTIFIDFIVFQYYSMPYLFQDSARYQVGAFEEYLCFSTIMGCIVMINFLEIIYIQVAINKTERFPFFKLRRRVTGQERLSKVWMILGCSGLKTAEYAKNKIPKKFYDNQKFYSSDNDDQ